MIFPFYCATSNHNLSVRSEVVQSEEKLGYDDDEWFVRLSGSSIKTVDRLLVQVIVPLERKTTGLILINGTVTLGFLL